MLSLGHIALPASSFAIRHPKEEDVVGHPLPMYRTVSPTAVRHVSAVSRLPRGVSAPKSIMNASLGPEDVPEPVIHVGDRPPNTDVLPLVLIT